MSNTIEFSEVHTPNISGVDGQVPYSLITNKLPSAINTNHQLRSVQASNGSTSLPSTMIQFQIPSMGYLKRNSVLLRFLFQTTALSGTATTWSFNNSINNCQSICKNVRLLLGNTIVENIINYNTFQTIHASHATNKDYLSSTLNILEGAMNDATGLVNNQITSAGGGLGYSGFLPSTNYEFICQLQLGTLNSTIPLWLMNQPLTIQIDTASVSEAVVSLDGVPTVAIASYTITNPTLLYETIDIPHEVKASIRQEMMETGKMYELECPTVLGVNTSVGAGSNLSYNLACNLGSVDSVLYTSILASAFTNTFGINSYKDCSYLETSATDTQINKKAYIDGRVVNSYNITTPEQIYIELRRCLSTYNTNISSIGAYNVRNDVVSTYSSRFFAGGFNLRKSLGTECSLTGSKVGILQLNFDTSSVAPNLAGNYYIYILFDQKIMISALGEVIIAK